MFLWTDRNLPGNASFLDDMILLEVKASLKQTTLSISEIAFKIGKDDPSDFSKFFKTKTGLTPKEYSGHNLPQEDPKAFAEAVIAAVDCKRPVMIPGVLFAMNNSSGRLSECHHYISRAISHGM